MTGSHAATVSDPIAVHADRFRVRLLENGLLVGRHGPVFGRRCRAEDERDEQSFHVETPCQFYMEGGDPGFSTFGSLVLFLSWSAALGHTKRQVEQNSLRLLVISVIDNGVTLGRLEKCWIWFGGV
jgi:hypothetical protein